VHLNKLGQFVRAHKWLLGIVTTILVTGAIAIYELDQHFSPILKAKAIEMLSQHLDSEVEIQDLHASIFELRIDGSGIAIRHHGRTDVPPLIRVKKFYADANVWDILAQRWNVHKVRIEGLEINIPPKEKREFHSNAGRNAISRCTLTTWRVWMRG
jgi:hypothetical protein